MSDLRRLLFANQTRAYEGYPLVISRSVASRYLKQYQMYGNSEQGLPAGYTPLEYIESTGTQYIDTGIKITQNYRVEVRYCYHETSSVGTSGRIAGGRYTSGTPRDAFALGTQNGKADPTTNMFAQFGTGSSAYLGPRVVIGDWFTAKLSADGYYVNDTAYQTPIPTDDFETPYTVKLFAFEQSAPGGDPTIGCGVGRCADFKIYTNNVLVMDLVPVKNSSNVIGMYDTVSGTFFTNQGTGSFTAGPALPTPANPIDVVSVGDKTVNLFDKNNLPERIIAYFANSGTTWSYTPQGYSLRFPCLPNTTYTARYNGNSTQAVLSFASTSDDNIPTSSQTTVTVTQAIRQNSPTTSTPITLTTGASDKWLIVQYNAADPQNTDMRDNLQIEQGSTATSYVPYGYQIPVVAQGKNLFDNANCGFIDGKYITNTGEIASTGGVGYTDSYTPVKPNTTYTWSGKDGTSSSSYYAICEYGADKTFISRGDRHISTVDDTFTTGANTYYLRFNLQTSDTRTTLQLEQGSSATPYAPYGHSTTPIYLNAPLRKVGDTYADVLDYKKGQIIRNVGIKVLDGTENWVKYNDGKFALPLIGSKKKDNQEPPFCSHFIGISGDNVPATDGRVAVFNGSIAPTSGTLGINHQATQELADFKAYLAQQYAAGTPVTVYYPLATPVTESIVAPALPTMAGSTTYTTDTEVKPSNMKGVF